MKNFIEKLTQPSSWAGLGTAVMGVNFSTIAELGTAHWWAAVVTVVGGTVAFFVKGRQ